MSRLVGQRISPGQRIRYAAALRELWLRAPTTRLLDACAATGAPREVAQHVRRQLIAAGVVAQNPSEVAQAAAGLA